MSNTVYGSLFSYYGQDMSSKINSTVFFKSSINYQKIGFGEAWVGADALTLSHHMLAMLATPGLISIAKLSISKSENTYQWGLA